MITIKQEVKTEVMESEDNEEEAEISVPECGEGGVLVHGRAVLSTADRGDLFSPDLEQKLTSVICNLCSQISYDFSTWRAHCLTNHSSVPGYAPSLITTNTSLTSQHFAVTLQNPYVCTKCSRSFPTQDALEDHKLSEIRTVRLVCPQCRGQYGDLEQHMLDKHAGDKICAKCEQPWLNTRNQNIRNLVDHHHQEHQGFSSVIAESSSRCAGDGVTIEWFETVLSSEARFLASEVKPEKASTETIKTQPKVVTNVENDQKMAQMKSCKSPHQQNLLYKNNPSATSGPIITNISGSFPIYARNTTSEVMTESERHAYNVKSYAKFKDSGVGLSRNECELCGFVPYTKNKYREKQDHLAKFHFKERIEAVLPTSRPYSCPDPGCEYLGKDKQDILRHYTGKHNILKMWVDAFIREQTGWHPAETVKKQVWQADSKQLPYKKTGEALTFQEMEVLAIENERKQWKKGKPTEEAPTVSTGGTIATDPTIIFTTQDQQTSFTISKIRKAGGGLSPKVGGGQGLSPKLGGVAGLSPKVGGAPSPVSSIPDTAPSISLIRINKKQQGAGVQEVIRTPLFVSQTRSEKPQKSPKHEQDPDIPVSPPASSPIPPPSVAHKPMFMVKYNCDYCSMSLPSPPALALHQEVCQETQHQHSHTITQQPPKKKIRRPPPALIPL